MTGPTQAPSGHIRRERAAFDILLRDKTGRSTDRIIFAIAIFLCAIFAINALLVPLLEASQHILKNVNEGWNAYAARRAMDGSPLYPQPPALIVNNYPPLSFYIVGLLGKVIGDNVIAGRIASLIAFFVIAANLGIVVAGRTASKRAGVFTAVYFAAVFSVFPGARVGLDDPQLLAHAIMLSGFTVFWLGGERFGPILLGAALMVTAGLVKQNIIALPVALTLWLALFDRRRLRLWLMAAGLCLVIGGAALVTLWGPGAITSILSPRISSAAKSFSLILVLREMMPSLTILTLIAFYPRQRLSSRAGDFSFGLVYVVLSVCAAFAFYGGAGVSSNAAFDVVISVALAIGLFVGALPAGQEKLAILAALVLGQYAMFTTGIATAFHGSAAMEEQQDKADIAYLSSHPGQAICTDPTLCYWAGKDFLFDSFNLDQLYQLRKRDPEIFLRKIRAHEFSVIALDGLLQPGDMSSPDTFWSQFAGEVTSYYRVDRVTPKHAFYVPKAPP